jgi:hypothetical protein
MEFRKDSNLFVDAVPVLTAASLVYTENIVDRDDRGEDATFE